VRGVRTPAAGITRGRPRADSGAQCVAPRLAELRVLVVDDDADAREVVAMFLAAHGARPIEVRSAEDARRRLAALPVDVVVTDFHMPDEDGLALVARIRSTPGYERVPCVVLSGSAALDAETVAAIGPRVAFVPKPFDPLLFVDAVARLLQS
jgi:CheY-like chemotaxis protein